MTTFLKKIFINLFNTLVYRVACLLVKYALFLSEGLYFHCRNKYCCNNINIASIPPLQLSIQSSPQRTSKWPNRKPHWATRQQAIAKTPAKRSAYQITSVTVVFVILVFKVWFVSFYSRKPQEALNLLVTEERYWALFYMPLYTCFYTICWMY
jgi:hypothetical protein